MPLNGSGSYGAPASSWNPAVTNTTINSTDWTALLADLSTALSTAIYKDGQSTPTANIPMGGFKLTGLGLATALTDAPRLSQVQNNIGSNLTGVAGTNTVTGTATPTPAYAVGQRFTFIPAVTNTGATTLNISSVGPGAVQWAGAALTGGELVAGVAVTVLVTAATPVFEIVGPTQFSDTRALIVGGTDSTKKVRFEVDGLTTGTTRVVTVPDADITLVGTTSLGLVKLTSGSVSAQATLEVVMTAYTAYRHKVLVADFLPDTDAVSLGLRVSTDGGSSYDSGAANYSYGMTGVDSAGATLITGNTDGTNPTAISITPTNVGNSATEGVGFTLTMHNTTSTSLWPKFAWKANYIDATATPRGCGVDGFGDRRAAQDTDAVRFFFSAGNLASGSWTLYGYN